MASANVNKSTGPVINEGLCRCCRSTRKCRLLTSEYQYNGAKEVYCDMFMEVFGLCLPHLDGDSMDCCICAKCVARLRKACDFRKQVLQSEQLFLEARVKTVVETEKTVNVKIEVKNEPSCGSDSENQVEDTADRTDDSEIDTTRDEMPIAIAVANIKSLKRPRIGQAPCGEPLSTGDRIRRLYRKMKVSLSQEPPAKKVLTKRIQNPLRTSSTFYGYRLNQDEPTDENQMVLSNTVTIVTNSYVCPFRNKISLYYCFYCRDQFMNPTELREHTFTHDVEQFESKLVHYNRTPIVDITRIDCRLCQEKIEDVDAFKCHITSKHQKVLYPVKNEFLKVKLTLENFTCTECDEEFSFFDSLKRHMVDHFGTNTCDVCGTCFLEPATLLAHIKTHSKVDANYPCEICGKNLKNKYSMGLHVATVHEKKPTVYCYKCDAAFLSYALRNRHLREAHGDKRSYSCKLCDKVFRMRKNLTGHHRRCHLKANKHKCDVCARTFFLPSSLKAHMGTHTGEKNFKCKQCDKSYSGRKSLITHMRLQHQ